MFGTRKMPAKVRQSKKCTRGPHRLELCKVDLCKTCKIRSEHVRFQTETFWTVQTKGKLKRQLSVCILNNKAGVINAKILLKLKVGRHIARKKSIIEIEAHIFSQHSQLYHKCVNKLDQQAS